MSNPVYDPVQSIPAPTRRAILRGAAAGLAVAATPLHALGASTGERIPRAEIPPPETLVRQLFGSLSIARHLGEVVHESVLVALDQVAEGLLIAALHSQLCTLNRQTDAPSDRDARPRRRT